MKCLDKIHCIVFPEERYVNGFAQGLTTQTVIQPFWTKDRGEA